MSQAKLRTELQRKAYLQRVLKLNPLSDAEHVLSLRDRYHRREDKKSNPQAVSEPVLGHEEREDLTRKIQTLRKKFWKIELDELREQLGRLTLENYPDLQNAANRLMTLAENRHLFGKLAANEKFNRTFLSTLKEVLPLSQKEAAELKESFRQKLFDPARATHVKRSLKILKRDAPAIYNLEAEWFEHLKQTKGNKAVVGRQAEHTATEEVDTNWGWAIWIGVIILVKILGALARG